MNKSVIVTGASGGLGLEVVRYFSNNGYFVYALDIKPLSEEIDNTKFIKIDIRNIDSIQDAYNVISKEIEQLDLIINVAGIYDLNSLIEMSEEEFIKIFDINLFGVYRINKIFTPLLKNKGKIIITTSELAPLDPLPFTGIYGISKAALEKYAYSLRMELQLLDKQVVVIRPGAIKTSLLDVSLSRIDSFIENTTNYKIASTQFKDIVLNVENKNVSPTKVAKLIYKISLKKKPKYIYKINRNPLLIILSKLPKRFQNWVIKKILTKK